jgi:hypothetical protein
VAHQFPEILTYGLAFRFAMEAEEACADIAAAAVRLVPSAAWQGRLEELVCAHRNRLERLTVLRQEADGTTLKPIGRLEGGCYLGALDKEPDNSWPAVVKQLIRAEEDTARYHKDLAKAAHDVLGISSRAFKRAANQDRAAAAELRDFLFAADYLWLFH